MPFFEAWHRMDADYFEVESGEDFSYPAHVHRCYEAILLLEGEMRISVDGVEELLRAGDVAFICPNQVHSLETPLHSRHKLFIFAPELIAAFHRQHAKRVPSKPRLALGEGALYALLCALRREDSIYAAKGALYSLCDRVERGGEFVLMETQATAKSGSVLLLREILAYIQGNFRDECTLSGLSRAIKYDMSYLSKFFKAQVGISFSSYVNQVRIAHACYLLLNTDKTVIQVSHECGNVSLRTFNRNFIEQMGCTPSEYRGKRKAE